MRFIAALLFLFSLSASAQDTSAWTTHPDEDQTKLMNYFAMGNAQANGQAQSAQAQILQNQHNLDMAKLRQDQIAMEQAQRQSQAALPITRAPYLSVGSGAVAPETAVQVRSPNHAAFLFYTTDGWTPTTASPRYKDAIVLRESTDLRVMAIAPSMRRSEVVRAVYTVGGATAPPPAVALNSDGVLHAGTRLRLLTSTRLNSKTAKTGDLLGFTLEQEIRIGDTIVVPRGTQAVALVTQAFPAGLAGGPGSITFRLHSFLFNGKRYRLNGGETLEGEVATAHGSATTPPEAEILPGMAVTAIVAADSPLKP